MRYTPQTLRTTFIDGGSRPPWRGTRRRCRNRNLKAGKLPLALSASSPVISWSRPWWSERNAPERSSVHFTGLPSARGVREARRTG